MRGLAREGVVGVGVDCPAQTGILRVGELRDPFPLIALFCGRDAEISGNRESVVADGRGTLRRTKPNTCSRTVTYDYARRACKVLPYARLLSEVRDDREISPVDETHPEALGLVDRGGCEARGCDEHASASVQTLSKQRASELADLLNANAPCLPLLALHQPLLIAASQPKIDVPVWLSLRVWEERNRN